MADELLRVENVSAGIESGQILHDASLTVGKGETHVLMGPNGAGKSTLGNVIMGSPVYKVSGGRILFDGEDITSWSADRRARAGIFLSFQNPIEVPGISLERFIMSAIRVRTGKNPKRKEFRQKLFSTMEFLEMDHSYAERDLNAGFSGGEKKKAEILQMLMLEPKLAILDETDSGLDVDAVRIVSKGIEEYHLNQDGALLIITHNAGILRSLQVDRCHVLVKGHVAAEGGPELVKKIQDEGFEAYTGGGADA